jgi:hypothetical protein
MLQGAYNSVYTNTRNYKQEAKLLPGAISTDLTFNICLMLLVDVTKVHVFLIQN